MRTFNCTICGYSFDPDGRAACNSCPIYQGCEMVCCPSCGFTTLDHNQSTIVRWVNGLARRRNGPQRLEAHTSTLREMPTGTLARVFSFADLEKGQIEKLQAYGVFPGQWVRVIQQLPVTVIDLGNIELALEEDLAEKIIMNHSSTQSKAASSYPST